MMDVHRRFRTVLDEIVKEWKSKENVKGVYVYGSFAKGTITANSDLDLCIVWDEDEAPTRLLAEQKTVRVDMTFLTPAEIQAVLEEKSNDPFKIAEVIGRLKEAKVVYDRDGDLKKWQEKVAEFRWPENVIRKIHDRAVQLLKEAKAHVEKDELVSATELVRNALFDLGRVILMRNNLFGIFGPSEVLSEVRMLDPIAYQLFLRTFKLRGMEEEDIMDVLEDVKHWLQVAEERLETAEAALPEVIDYLAQAQREYHGAMNQTIAGDYELAVMEMRRAMHTLGRTLLLMDGIRIDNVEAFVSALRENEPEFFDQIFIEYGAFDFQFKGIIRSIGEAEFIAKRL